MHTSRAILRLTQYDMFDRHGDQDKLDDNDKEIVGLPTSLLVAGHEYHFGDTYALCDSVRCCSNSLLFLKSGYVRSYIYDVSNQCHMTKGHVHNNGPAQMARPLRNRYRPVDTDINQSILVSIYQQK